VTKRLSPWLSVLALGAACGVLVSLSLAEASVAVARARRISESDKRWLARAMVAEADWDAPGDHSAIAHVLWRRWLRHRENFPTFESMIRRYCRALRRARSPFSRQRWVQTLPFNGDEEPRFWPEEASWSNHVERWREVRDRVERFARGTLLDPCPRAIHWGGTMDPDHGWRRVRCYEPTHNRFYRLR
jgi:hypothetical protein